MHVLIVEDTKMLRALIQVFMMGASVTFEEAQDGAEGLARCRARRPDLVISDVRMPNMDGFELCAAIRADPALRDVPVILLTTLDDEASRQHGHLVGADAFLTKPVTPAELREAVARVVAPTGGA
jgi:CheY-like chemotaxis protein